MWDPSISCSSLYFEIREFTVLCTHMADSSSASTAAAARARREARKSMRRMQTTGVDSTNNDAPPSPDRRNRSSLRAERRALGLSREMSSSVDLDSSPSRRSRLGGQPVGVVALKIPRLIGPLLYRNSKQSTNEISRRSMQGKGRTSTFWSHLGCHTRSSPWRSRRCLAK